MPGASREDTKSQPLEPKGLATHAGGKPGRHQKPTIRGKGLATRAGGKPGRHQKPTIRGKRAGHTRREQVGKTPKANHWRHKGRPQTPPHKPKRHQKTSILGPRAGHKHRVHAEKTPEAKHYKRKGLTHTPRARREDTEAQEFWTQGLCPKHRPAHWEDSENQES